MEHGIFNNFVRNARIYFSTESTQEMLDEWRYLLCPFDMSMNKAIERFELFLPTLVYADEHEKTFKFVELSLFQLKIMIFLY